MTIWGSFRSAFFAQRQAPVIGCFRRIFALQKRDAAGSFSCRRCIDDADQAISGTRRDLRGERPGVSTLRAEPIEQGRLRLVSRIDRHPVRQPSPSCVHGWKSRRTLSHRDQHQRRHLLSRHSPFACGAHSNSERSRSFEDKFRRSPTRIRDHQGRGELRRTYPQGIANTFPRTSVLPKDRSVGNAMVIFDST